MKSGYRINSLHVGNALRAYCLMQLAAPGFPPCHWAELVAKTTRWKVLSLEDAGGYVRGLAAYRIRRHPVAGDLLDVPIFLALSTLHDEAIADMMFTSLRRRSMACDYVRVWTRLPSDFTEMEDEGKFSRWDYGLMVKVDQNPSPALL